MKVELRIDRIVLDGIPLSPVETRRMTRALERELLAKVTAMAAAHPAARESWRGGAVPSLAAPPIALDQRGSGARLGRSLAHSVHQCLEPMALSPSPSPSPSPSTKGAERS